MSMLKSDCLYFIVGENVNFLLAGNQHTGIQMGRLWHFQSRFAARGGGGEFIL